MAGPILEVTDLEGDFNQFVNPGLLEAPAIPDGILTQYIYLPNGWSLFSFWIDLLQIANWDTATYPNGLRMSDLLKQFLYKQNPNGEDTLVYDNPSDWSRVIIVKNNLGLAYLPEFNFDGISGANPQPGQDNFLAQGVPGQYQGYQIKIGVDGPPYYIKISGPQHIPNTTATDNFPVLNGWNIIGIPYKDAVINAEVFVQEFLDNVIIMKDYIGAALLPEWNFNGIGDLIAGQGYQLKLGNHTSPNTVVVTYDDNDMGPPIDDPIDDTPIINDNVNVIDDTPLIADADMTIKVPQDVIEGFLPDLGISHILNEKRRLIDIFYGGGKSVNFDGGRQVQPQLMLANETEKKEEGKAVITNPFQEAYNNVVNKFPAGNSPSGYSVRLEKVINDYWLFVKDKPISFLGKTGTALLNEFLSNINFRFSFFAYEPTKDNLVGRVEFNFLLGGAVKNFAISCQGDDSTTTEDEGLVSGESPRIFFFSGEKYYLCNFTLASSDLSFVNRKVVEVSSVTLASPVLKPV